MSILNLILAWLDKIVGFIADKVRDYGVGKSLMAALGTGMVILVLMVLVITFGAIRTMYGLFV